MLHDPIVAEVRAIREKLAAQCDFDIRRIFEEARQRELSSGRQVVSFERKYAHPATTTINHGPANEITPATGPCR